MYGNTAPIATAAGTAAALPYTGVSLVWTFLAAFALLAAGLAVVRIMPRRES